MAEMKIGDSHIPCAGDVALVERTRTVGGDGVLLIPYDHLMVTTPLSPEAVRHRLTTVVEPQRFVRLTPKPKPYQGRVQDDRFTVTRIISFGLATQPVIVGAIEPTPAGTTLCLTFRPRWSLLGWCGSVALPSCSG